MRALALFALGFNVADYIRLRIFGDSLLWGTIFRMIGRDK
jgi:hypothetical protein